MRISRIQIQNFRNFHDLDIALGEHAVIVGENKIGKSNLLFALRLLLDPSLPDSARQLKEEDFPNPISSELAAYDACVESSPFHEFEPEKPDVPEPPSGNGADMGVSPTDGIPNLVPNNNELFIETMKNCLKQHPLAALDSHFSGLSPGNVF